MCTRKSQGHISVSREAGQAFPGLDRPNTEKEFPGCSELGSSRARRTCHPLSCSITGQDNRRWVFCSMKWISCARTYPSTASWSSSFGNIYFYFRNNIKVRTKRYFCCFSIGQQEYYSLPIRSPSLYEQFEDLIHIFVSKSYFLVLKKSVNHICRQLYRWWKLRVNFFI